MELQLLQHLKVNMDGSLPKIPSCLYAYIMAGNGVFVYAWRLGLEALIPVLTGKIAGLPELTPRVNIAKRVPASLLEDALRFCKQVFPNETLFWFNWTDDWSIHIPDQQITNASAVPCDRHDKAGTRALIDLHSHARFSPLFSPTDNQDEVGFRIYAVIGNVDKTPTISVRVGVYSHYFNIPASAVFELPDGIHDIYEQEDFQYEDK
jgi:PRTRC genetic system protein A